MDIHRFMDLSRPKGILLLIGGHEDKAEANSRENENHHPKEILKEFINLTGHSNPTLEVVTTASSEASESFEDYRKTFAEFGVSNIRHIHHDQRSEALGEELVQRVHAADGIFFTGGDQLKLTSIYGGTPFLQALKEHYVSESCVVAGTSAGAMAFSTPMIFAGNKEKQQIAGEVRITTGLEFLKDVCIDTHFVDRSRFVRMAQVIATNPNCIGMGIEENTAVVIRKGVDMEVLGSGVVVMMDGFGITKSNILEYGSDTIITIHDVNLTLLSKNSTFRLPIAGLPPA